MLRPKKKITRKEIQRDPFLESVDQVQAHLEENRSLYLKIAIGVIVVLVFYNIRSNRQTQHNMEASASLGKALVTIDQGDKSSAQFQLETVYNDYDGTSSAYTASYYLGKIKYDAGETEDAEEYLSSFLKKNSKNSLTPSAVIMLADIFINQNKMNDALIMIDKTLKNSEKYDAINLTQVLEHVNNPIEFLKKCHRLLKSGGIIVIEAPNDYNPLQKIVQKSLKKEEYWLTVLTKSRSRTDSFNQTSKIDHVNYFNFFSLKRLLTKLKFKVVYQQSTFPLELFLLMGDDYLKNEKIGKKINQKRINLEMNLMAEKNGRIKKELYEKFAEIGIGRASIIYAKK